MDDDKKPKHTPGPWEFHVGDDYLEVRQLTKGMFRVIYRVAYPDAEDIANARLLVHAAGLLAACKAQHDAIDWLFAKLITLTGQPGIVVNEQFYPSKSPAWPACVLGNEVIKAVEKDQ